MLRSCGRPRPGFRQFCTKHCHLFQNILKISVPPLSIRCSATARLTPRSPCLASSRSSPRPSSHLRLSPAVVTFSNPYAEEAENLYCAAAAPFRTSPLSFRSNSSYLQMEDGTSPTSSRLTVHSLNPSNPCSSVLRLSGLLDPSSLTEEKMESAEGEEENPRTPLPHHTCSLCSLIRRHDLRSTGSLASRSQRAVGGEPLREGPPCIDEEEEGHCKCTEDELSPPPSPTSPPTVKAKPVLAPYFPPSPPVQEIGEGGSHLKSGNLQVTSVCEVPDPVEDQYLAIKRTLDTLLQKRRSPSAMVRASHASCSLPERLI